MDRLFIKKKPELDTERQELLNEFRDYLEIKELEDLEIIHVYDLIGGSSKDKNTLLEYILDPITDILIDDFKLEDGELGFRVKDLKGQFNKREHFTNRLINLIFPKKDIEVRTSKIIIFKGINEEKLKRIKDYYINPIEIKEIDINDTSIDKIDENSEGVIYINGFINYTEKEVEEFKNNNQIGMDIDDLLFIQNYFKDINRDPNLTEIELIDTYWSDHCRHTTFTTRINNIEIEEGKYKSLFEEEIKRYVESRNYVYENIDRPVSLMDLGTINMKELSKKGLLDDKEDTEEINAASIEIDVDVDGRNEKWLLMFKNETHNHPTEIEPFGGAATCLGGAIRDPLSGRSYVYQAMRISGAKDPREEFDNTLKGKLPQRKISRRAMEGYSSYGNEIGASTGFVREIYDDGFLAKRMECGALIAASPKENVYRGTPSPGDKIILVGGRTGRDGLGGAVGSSMEHSEDSLDRGGAEVQKGNPSLERKIIRLFRKKEVSTIIKVCNDFGAGGVGVAIGEIADGLIGELDKVPLKYEGLSPTEILLSESQERMACLVDKGNVDKFLKEAEKEDLEATVVAEVTKKKRLIFTYNGEKVVDIERRFLDTNGVDKETDIKLLNPNGVSPFEVKVDKKDLEKEIINKLKDLNIASQKGLIENFDNTVSGETVVMPYGGKYMLSPSEGMVSKIPVEKGNTNTTSIMTYGYDPGISKWSPFHGGYFAVIESISRVIALGGNYEDIRFTFQEYFERLGEDKTKWGKPFLSLLGAYRVLKDLSLPSIGGKDSMSGTFEDIDVPPTLISFAVNTENIENIITSEFKNKDSQVVLVDLKQDENFLIDSKDMMEKYERIYALNKKGLILSASSIKNGGIIRSILEMSFGNKIGFKFEDLDIKSLFTPKYGSIILELSKDIDVNELEGFTLIGHTIEKEELILNNLNLNLDDLIEKWTNPLEKVFPVVKANLEEEKINIKPKNVNLSSNTKTKKPKVLIPIFTGTHGEYTLENSFIKAGGEVDRFVFKTLSETGFKESLEEFSKRIKESQILAIPHGVVFGGEPNCGGKLGKYILDTPYVKEAINNYIENTDGLILGIGEGFQILLKSGLIGNGVLGSNKEGGFISTFTDIEVVDNNSPWFNMMEKREIYTAPIGTYEGRLILDKIGENTKITTRFIDRNPTGSVENIESLSSLDGRILGTISNIDRMKKDLYKNINIRGNHKIFQSAIKYFD